MKYDYYPRLCTPEFRQFLFDYFPALAEKSERGRRRRLIAEHCLFGQQIKDGHGFTYQIIPKEMVAQWLGTDQSHFIVAEMIEDFERHCFALNASGWSKVRHQCREIRPDVPEEVLQAKKQDLQEHYSKKIGFVDGDSWSERRRRKLMGEIRSDEIERAAEEAIGHPAEDVMIGLNGQDHRNFSKVKERNLEAVKGRVNEYPTGSKIWDYCDRVCRGIDDEPMPIYHPSPDTARIFDHGISWHSLPRELRALAFSGMTTLDLACSQMAIVSSLWNIDSVHEILASGRSLWPIIMDDIGVGRSAKPAVKDSTYSVCFGKRVGSTKKELGIIDTLALEIGSEAAIRYINHPLVVDTLDARRVAQSEVSQRGGVTDAFGRQLELGQYSVIDLLAQQMQAVELRIMLAGYEVIKQIPDLRVFSWLHDGITIFSTDASKERRQIRQVIEAINAEARALGVPTWIEE